MDEKYPITLDDVKRFLATKGENEEIGYCGNARHCLLAEVLTWLYPDERPWQVGVGLYSHIFATQSSELPHALSFLMTSFDYCRPQLNVPATKRHLREYLQWLTTQQDFVTEPAKMPFSIDDLFGGNE